MSLNIGLVGIGVMGSNLALNMSDNSINVKVYNKSEEKINTLINKDLNNNIEGYTSLKTLVENLEKPRTVMLLVPSGEATKTVIDDLTNLLDKEDLIIDAGNSYFLDSSEMGNLCEKKGVKFIGMGVSGGEEGARNGPALMIGSKDPINETLKKCYQVLPLKKMAFRVLEYMKDSVPDTSSKCFTMELNMQKCKLLQKHTVFCDQVASII